MCRARIYVQHIRPVVLYVNPTFVVSYLKHPASSRFSGKLAAIKAKQPQ